MDFICVIPFYAKMDLYSVIMCFNNSIMLVPRRRVSWIREDESVINMDMQTFLFRSFLEQLLDDGVQKDELDKVLKQMYVDENEYPTGEPYSVIFH